MFQPKAPNDVQSAATVAAPSGDPRIEALRSGYKWGTHSLTYSFYAGGSYYGTESSPAPVSDAVKANVRYIFENIYAPAINMTFTEVPDTASSYGVLRFLASTSASYAYAYTPTAGDTNVGTFIDVVGDVVLNPSSDITGSDFNSRNNSFQSGPGSHGFCALVHEMGHALGLKHPFDTDGSGVTLPAGENNQDNTVMTYTFNGSEPATLMAYDALALQYFYGANTSARSGDTTYAFTAVDNFSPGSGSAGAPKAPFGRMRQMLWDAGGTDTIDLSAVPADAGGYRIDIQPGGWITANSAYNSVTYSGSYVATNYGTRIPLSGTTIENVVVTRSADTIYLNSAANTVSGYTSGTAGGADVIYNSNQADTLDLRQFARTSVVESQVGNDLVLNLGASGTVTVKDYFATASSSRMLIRYKPDTTIVITSDRSTFKTGDTATITFTLGMTSTNFMAGDVTVSGGTLTNFSGAGKSYTATFAPAPNFAGSATITVAAGVFTDADGTPNAAGSLQLTVDTVLPTVTMARIGSNTLKIGDSTTVSFTLSKASTNFVVNDVTVLGGTLSGFGGSGTSYTARFTPAVDIRGSSTITVAAGTFTDAVGNPNAAAGPFSISVDTVQPTVAITRAGGGTLKIGDSETLTFTLSENATDFAAADVTVIGGSIAGFAGSGRTYTATFTPATSFQGVAQVSVAAGVFTNPTGNPNKAATLNFPVDTVPPTVAITRSGAGALKIGSTETITFTLSEAGTTFAAGNVTVTGGTLSGFAGSGTTYTATFTPTPNFEGTAGLSVAVGVFADSAGNVNVAGASLAIPVDTRAPTVSVAWSGNSPLFAGDTATVTFTLSEPSSDFTVNDATVTNGSLVGFSGSGASYTATFKPAWQFVGTGTVTVAAGTFTDLAGNAGLAGNTVSIPIDTVAPYIRNFSASVTSARLRIGDSVTLTANFSEGLLPTAGAVTVRLNSGASVSLVLDAGGTSATGVYTVQPGEVAADLDVIAIESRTSTLVSTATGRKIDPTLPSPNLADAHGIVVDGAVKLREPGSGFSVNPVLVRDLGGVQRIPLRFTTTVNGLNLESFRLSVNNVVMPLQGGRIEGSGDAYTLILPVSRVRPYGIYRLEIAPAATIRATSNGALASNEASLWWGNRQSVGMVPDAPAGLMALQSAPVRGKITAALTWQAPAGNGGGSVTEYFVDYRIVGTSTWLRVRATIPASSNPGISIQGLVAGRNYEFRVAARNSSGIGPYATAQLLMTPIALAVR